MNLQKITKIAALMACSGLISTTALAQPNEKNLYSLPFIKSTNGWLNSDNASGLANIPVNNISYVQASFDKTNGGFVNYFQSNNSYNVNGITESLYRLSPRVVVSGKVSYDYFRGKNMGGSYFIDPYFTPFDLVDSTTTNTGTKNLENFNLVGGVSVKIIDNFYFGGKIDYTTSNYAKFKDLRHVNSLMDLKINAGLRYDIGDIFDIGVNYKFRRRVESIDLNTYGTTDKRYYTIVSYGSFYGKREEFGDAGMTDDKRPLAATFHGASLQLNFDFNKNISWFNEFSFNNRSGYYGIKSASKIVYTEDKGIDLGYKTFLNINQNKNIHTININGSYTNLSNYENIFQEISKDGVIVVEYFDKKIVLDKTTIDAHLAYTANLNVNRCIPSWVIKAEIDGFMRNQETTIHPFYRKQNLISSTAFVNGTKNIIVKKNMFSIDLGAGYGFGTGTKNEDGTIGTPSSATKKPYSATYALDREFEFLTAHRINAAVGFKYSRFFKKGFTGYIGATYNFTNALNIEFLQGAMRHNAAITVGCSF